MKPTPENMAKRVYELTDKSANYNKLILRNPVKLERIFKALQMGYKGNSRVCDYAGISRQAMSRLLSGESKAHRAFQKFYRLSYNMPITKCLKSINKGIQTDPRLAMAHLERLAPEYTKTQQIDIKSERKNTLEITINDYRALSPQERKTQIDNIAKRMGMKMIDLEKNVDGIYELASPNEKDAGSGTTGTPGK